jgi:hypothetical protein
MVFPEIGVRIVRRQLLNPVHEMFSDKARESLLGNRSTRISLLA